MQDSDGHVELFDEKPEPQFRTRYPVPPGVDARKVMKALEKWSIQPGNLTLTDSTLLGLTPFEKGYVMGIITSLGVRQ